MLGALAVGILDLFLYVIPGFGYDYCDGPWSNGLCQTYAVGAMNGVADSILLCKF